jgi:hypothetical protein
VTLLEWIKRLFRRPKPGVGKGKAPENATEIALERPQETVGRGQPTAVKGQNRTASKRTQKARKRTRTKRK